VYKRPIRAAETPLARLLRLDANTRPGLTEIEFSRLFAKCQCGLITTLRVFDSHFCAIGSTTVLQEPFTIDLTGDDVIDVIDLSSDED
jgi:hypothetical protein